jgi:hypothetical protein
MTPGGAAGGNGGAAVIAPGGGSPDSNAGGGGGAVGRIFIVVPQGATLTGVVSPKPVVLTK